jgi:hypothetical protein
MKSSTTVIEVIQHIIEEFNAKYGADGQFRLKTQSELWGIFPDEQ